ncbi:hypothetical protein [Asticcacaulis tiandongensis]|uniref:hypothetical protein n=1 Tax=Asticcacaulis tiandongensis TaxID=2565365 RepID=UPI00112ED545|nr:hypothetical protein [Asticcacaulis tiandongensis]
MADTQHIAASKAVRKKPSPYLGVTREGIKIVRPSGRVDNVTLAQAREAVATLLAEKAPRRAD